MSSRSLLADVQLLRLLHLQHRRIRWTTTHRTRPGATSRRNPTGSAGTVRLSSDTASRTTWTRTTGTSPRPGSTVVTPGGSSTRTGTPRRNVARTVRTAVTRQTTGRRSVWRVLLLLIWLVEPTGTGSHLLSGSAHPRWHPVHLRLEIEFVLRGVQFLLDKVRSGERWHVAFVELRTAGTHYGSSRVVRVVHVVLPGTKLAKLGIGWPLGWIGLRTSGREAHSHGIFVLVLFGHVFEGLRRRGQFRHGTVLWVPVRATLRGHTVVSEGIRELVRHGTAPLDAHVVQHSGTWMLLLYAGLLLHLDLLLLLGM